MTANLFLMATLGLAATGAGFLVAPHATAWVDAALDGCPAEVGASAHAKAFSGKPARATAHAQAAGDCGDNRDNASAADEECEHEKAARHAGASREKTSAAASVEMSVSA